MKKRFRLTGDTPIGYKLQKKADAKKQHDQIIEYISLDTKSLSKEQRAIKLADLAEKWEEEDE